MKLPITLGEDHLHLRINGNTLWKDDYKNLEHQIHGNKHNLRTFVTAMAVPQCLVFNKITDWSKSEQILTLRNITHDKFLQYEWLEWVFSWVLLNENINSISNQKYVWSIIPFWPSLVICFYYSRAGIKHVVDINTYPQSGILKPKECHRILVKLKTYKESILSDLLMICTITDRSEVYLYNKSIGLYEEEEKRLEGQFIITEKSVRVPVMK